MLVLYLITTTTPTPQQQETMTGLYNLPGNKKTQIVGFSVLSEGAGWQISTAETDRKAAGKTQDQYLLCTICTL